MKMSATADVQDFDTPGAAPPSGSDFAELMESAYMIVAVASPSHPSRSRVEWLVGGWERGARAIDALLSHGFLKEIEGLGDEPRLVLGDYRRPIRLPGESRPRRDRGGATDDSDLRS